MVRMNKEIDEMPVFSWNTKTKEFYVLGHKFDGVNSIEDFINFINDLQQKNERLNKQLEYLKSGEYLNQLRFERDALQDLVDNGEVSKEDKKFIDMTHRNTELLEQLKRRNEVVDEAIKYINDKARKFEHQETRNIVNIEYVLILGNHEFIELEDILQKCKGDNNENTISES